MCIVLYVSYKNGRFLLRALISRTNFGEKVFENYRVSYIAVKNRA